jgi:hypothetical protein
MKKNYLKIVLSVGFILFIAFHYVSAQANSIVDTGQVRCYGNSGEILCPKPGEPFYGQDANYQGVLPLYKDNGDGTITDLNTGLIWSKAVDKTKLSLDEAKALAAKMNLAGYDDWRVPDIKELYSLIDFRGNTGSGGGMMSSIPSNAVPFINTDFFDFEYGDTGAGERYIDAQWLSSTQYVSTTMAGNKTLFGVNFADGRIKGYGYRRPGSFKDGKKFFVRYVRGNEYGKNVFVDNGDGTVTDKSSGLMWTQQTTGGAMNWQDALKYAEKLIYAGYNDWRLPNIKELQYIVDYSRSPDTTDSPAIDPIFQLSVVKNEDGKKDYPYIWSSTTHLDGPRPGLQAAYVSFGRAMGKMRGRIMDVHGAGAQRSDPKTGSPMSRGPQGDMVRVENFVLCVRGGVAEMLSGINENRNVYPYNFRVQQVQQYDRQDKRQDNRQYQQQGFSGFSQEQSDGGQSHGQRFIKRLDKNGDGKVSKMEFDGPKERFSHHDRNNDGYIDEDEAPQGPPPGK